MDNGAWCYSPWVSQRVRHDCVTNTVTFQVGLEESPPQNTQVMFVLHKKFINMNDVLVD